MKHTVVMQEMGVSDPQNNIFAILVSVPAYRIPNGRESKEQWDQKEGTPGRDLTEFCKIA